MACWVMRVVIYLSGPERSDAPWVVFFFLHLVNNLKGVSNQTNTQFTILYSSSSICMSPSLFRRERYCHATQNSDKWNPKSLFPSHHHIQIFQSRFPFCCLTFSLHVFLCLYVCPSVCPSVSVCTHAHLCVVNV